MRRSALMYCCRGARHSGNCGRTIEVARKLHDYFDVTVVLGDAKPRKTDFPDGIETVCLPPLNIDADNNVVDIRRSQELRDLVSARRNIMLREFERRKPCVVAIEDFPFRQHALKSEILPLIERARNDAFGDALVVGMTDGILADDTEREDARRDQTAELLDKYFDMIIVHSDPVFARVDEFFKPKNILQVPVYHTGFVVSDSDTRRADVDVARDTVLVSAGNGTHGGPLYRAAVEAHKILGSTLLLPMKIIAGEDLPEDEWLDLVEMVDGSPDVIVERTLPDLGAALADARWSISQCDYDTAVHTIQTRTPALLLPSAIDDRNVQVVRARRLVYWGAGRLLRPQHLTGASLANEIRELMRFQPRRMHFDLNGAASTANLISQVAYRSGRPLEAARSNANEQGPR